MEICRRPTNTGVGFRDFSKVWVALINISTRLKNINVIIDKVTLENIDIERSFLKTSIVHLPTLFFLKDTCTEEKSLKEGLV